MSTAGGAGGAGDKLFKNCWSCRVLSGGGLIAAGAYVMRVSTAQMRVGVPPSIGVVFQLTVAASTTTLLSLLLVVSDYLLEDKIELY